MGKPLENLEQFQPALNEIFERYDVALAYLYGSQARELAGPLSDVDVAVLFDRDVPQEARFQRALRLMEELGSLLRRNDVHVVDLAEASPLLRHRVYYDGKLVHCADNAQRVRFATATLRDYVDTEPLRRIKRRYVLQRFEQTP
jgi:predicted nucleotidyltransferase